MNKTIVIILLMLVFNVMPAFASQEDYATINPNASVEDMVNSMHSIYSSKNDQKLHHTSMICIMFHPDEFYGYYYEGIALYELSDYEGSINYFTKAINIAKTSNDVRLADTYINRAMSYHALGQTKDEIKDLYYAYKNMGNNYNPSSKTAVLNAIQKLKQTNKQDYDKAIREYNTENR